MDKKIDNEGFADSLSAIKRYVDYREENQNRHKARVLISSKGKPGFNAIVYVYISVNADNTFVIVEGPDYFYRDYLDKYRIKNNDFTFIRETLLIHTKDRWGNDIEIDITGV